MKTEDTFSSGYTYRAHYTFLLPFSLHLFLIPFSILLFHLRFPFFSSSFFLRHSQMSSTTRTVTFPFLILSLFLEEEEEEEEKQIHASGGSTQLTDSFFIPLSLVLNCRTCLGKKNCHTILILLLSPSLTLFSHSLTLFTLLQVLFPVIRTSTARKLVFFFSPFLVTLMSR